MVIFVFMVIAGLAFLLGWYVGRHQTELQTPKHSQHGLDLLAACSHLDRLHRLGRIDSGAYAEARKELEADCSAASILAPPRSFAPAAAEQVPVEVVEAEIAYLEGGEPPGPVPTIPQELRPPVRPPLVAQPAETPRHEPPPSEAAPAAAAPPEPQPSAAAAAPPAPWDVPDEPPPPRRTWNEILQGFMEEKNIRWGELTSGLLIVGSAVGLVISLRDALQQTIPYFPSLLFLLLTAAVHGAGLYTYRRWNLETTSRGVLVIGMLLVPLGFLSACILSEQRGELRPVTDPLYILAVVTGVLGYGAMCFISSGVLEPARRVWLSGGVIVSSAALLLINRLVHPDTSLTITYILALIPLTAVVVAMAGYLRGRLSEQQWDTATVEQFLVMLGLTGFAWLVALAFQVSRMGSVYESAQRLAPILTLAASLYAVSGMILTQRVTEATWKTTGAGLGIFGALMMGAGLLVAWPAPAPMMGAGLAGFVVLAVAAARQSNPVLFGASLAFLTPAWLVLTHWMLGNYSSAVEASPSEHGQALLSAASGLTLTALMALVGGAGFWRKRVGDHRSAQTLWIGCAVLGLVSVGCAVSGAIWKGLPLEVHVATGLLTAYGLAALAASCLAPGGARRPLIAGGAMLLLGACLQCATGQPLREFLARWPTLHARPWHVALLAHAVAMTVIATGWALWRAQRLRSGQATRLQRDHAEYLMGFAAFSGAVALPLGYLPHVPSLSAQTVAFGIAAAVWLVAARIHLSPSWFAVFEGLGAATLALLTADLSQRWGWWQSWWEAPHIQLQLAALGLWCWLLTALTIWRPAHWRRLLDVPLQLHQVLLGAVAAMLCGRAVMSCLPGWRQEIFGGASLDWAHLVEGGFTLSWLAWIVVTLAIATELWRRGGAVALAGLALVGSTAVLLAAPALSDSLAVASATRWLAGVWGLGFAALLAYRQPLHVRWLASGGASLDRRPPRLSLTAMISVVVATALPIVALTTAAVDWSIRGNLLGGPAEESIFGAMSDTVLYGVPLLLLAGSLLLHAVSLRLPASALAGGAAVQYLATLAYALHRPAAAWSEADTVQLLQWNLIAAGLYATAWLVLRPRMRTGEEPQPVGQRGCWGVYFGATLAVPVALAAWAILSIVVEPGRLYDATAAIGRWPGYLGLALSGGLAVAYTGRKMPRLTSVVWAGIGFCASGLLAATIDSHDQLRQWWAYHATMAAMTLSAAALAATLCLPTKWRDAIGLHRGETESALGVGGIVLGSIAALMAWRGAAFDPAGVGWSATICFVLAVVAGVLAVRVGQPAIVYGGAFMVVSAVTFISQSLSGSGVDWLYACVLGVSAYGLAWVAVERAAQESWLPWHGERHSRFHWQAAHAGAWILLLLGVAAAASARLTVTHTHLPYWAAASVVALSMACLWDRRWSRHCQPLFVAALAAVVVLVSQLTPHGSATYVTVGLAVSGYLACCGLLWRRRTEIDRLLVQLGSPTGAGRPAASWLGPVALGLSAALAVYALPAVLFWDERWMRFAAAFTPLLGAVSLAALAPSDRAGNRHVATIVLLIVFAIFAGWADIEQLAPFAAWLDRVVRLLTVLALSTGVLGLVAPRVLHATGLWAAAAKRMFVCCFGLALAVLLALLALEWQLFNPDRGAPLTNVQAWSVVVFLAAMIAGLISMALLPRHDPLSLPDHARVAYTYAAQAVAALLALHCYLSMPWLFRDEWRPYWPYIVMGLAFAGAALGEALQRSNIAVLGGPFLRTSLLLPLLPLAGMMVLRNESSYTAVAALTALLFALAAAAQRSTALGLISVAAGNFALWSLYRETDSFAFLAHPQFWLIPPAISALAAGQLNRRRLTTQQLAFLRYISVALIYISSTSEIFIQGMGTRLWPPMVLATLSVLGVLTGILIRVRAFLYFGTAFLLLAVVAMVSHAQQAFHHVWPWWAFGISLGVAILVLFGLFEKKRDEMQLLISQVRHWED